jgi:hypothetical protein
MKIDPRQRCRFVPAFFAIAALMASADSSAGPFFFYRFTNIADTQPGFPYSSLSPLPSINSSARVAYTGRFSNSGGPGIEAVFSRRELGGIDVLADSATSGYSLFGIDTSINSLHLVSFSALKGHDPTVTVLLRGQGNSATPIISDASSDPNHLANFCGNQINNEGRVAFQARRSDGTHEISTQAEGVLNGVHRVIADEVSGFTNLGCAPSIAHDGTVAFTATYLGRRGIFTKDEYSTNTYTEIINNSSTYSGFGDIALNQFGGLAFTAFLQGGGRGVYRWQNGYVTTLMDTYHNPTGGAPVAVAMNESGVVTYELSRDANGSSIYRGPGSLFGRIVGFGSMLFNNRMVFAAHMSRDAINSTGQVVVGLVFFDGSTVIARGDPVNVLQDIVVAGGLVLTAASEGSVNVGTSLPTPPKGAVMTFDLTFLSLGGRLDVKFGDQVVQSIRASDVGVRKVVSVPLDPKLALGGLQFAFAGGKGAGAQIANVTIPGLSSRPLDAEALASWKIDESGKGVAQIVDVARYPVKTQLVKAATQDPKKPGITLVNATVFSDDGVDASTDLLLGTLRVGGTAPRATKDKMDCTVSDVNGDKLPDLTCAVELTDAALKAGTLSVESMTQSGWAIEGAGALGVRSVRVAAPGSMPRRTE